MISKKGVGCFRRKHVIKIVSILLLQAFLFYSTGLAATGEITKLSKEETATKELTVDGIGISKDIGSIKHRYKGKDEKIVIHIQDAHCNYEAQTNISKILENFSKNYNINTISVEGADGYIDTSWFKAFPDAEIREEVADYFMKKGEITGAEFLSITKDYPIKLFGAENRDLYIKNLNAFTSSYPNKDEIEKYLLGIKSILGRLKGFMYSKRLKDFDNKVEEYKDKKITLSDYAKILSLKLQRDKISLMEYPDFGKLVYTLVYEDKIDFKIVDHERAEVIDKLSKALPKDKLQDLVLKSFSFKTGKVSAAEYYEYLKAKAQENKIELVKDYPNLANYVIYTSLYEKIDNENLFEELDAIKNTVKDKLFQNDDQRTLSACWDHINILLGLINIKLSNKEFDYYKAHKKEFKPDFFTDFITSKVTTYNLSYDVEAPSKTIKENLPLLEKFYEVATKRDKTLVNNTVKVMDEEKVDAAVLITGGFHTEGITNILEKMDISYVVVCPNITKDIESPYIQVLTNQKTPFEELLVESATPTREENLLAPWPITQLLSFSAKEIRDLDRRIIQVSRRGAVGTLEDRIKQAKIVWIANYIEIWIDRCREVATRLEAEGGSAEINRTILQSSFIIATNQAIDKHILPNRRELARQNISNLIEAEFQRRARSVGEFSMAVRAGEPRMTEEARLYDKILEESFAEAAVSSEGEAQGYPLDVRIHHNLEERIARYNDRALQEGRPTVAFSHGHPGTWRGIEEQFHISDLQWNHLNHGERKVTANHELVHIKIHKREGKEYDLWEAYVKYQEKRKEPVDQEDFIDRIKHWATTLSVEGISANDFPDCDTREIRKKIARLQADRITNNAINAMSATGDVDAFRMALTEAYVLAADFGERTALLKIVDFFTALDADWDERINMPNFCKPIFLQVAKWYPMSIRKDLFEDASTHAKELLNSWFNEAPAAKPRDVLALIMAGGGGERVFPLSMSNKPKQLADIIDVPLIVMAVERLVPDLGAKNVYIQTVPHLKDEIYKLLRARGITIPKKNIFTEPKGADTAGAVGYGAVKLKQLGRGSDVMFVGTADHYINTADGAFKRSYMDAATIAKNSPAIGTLGIDPEPIGVSEEYGCIEKGPETFHGSENAYIANTFIKKPKGELAQKVFNDRLPGGSHRWLFNSGMFIGRPEVFLEAFNAVAPYYGERFDRIASANPENAREIEEEVFDDLAKRKAEKRFPHSAEPTGFRGGVSVDYVLAQPLSRGETDRIGLFTIPGEFHWIDIGGYKAIYDYYKDVDKGQNATLTEEGNVIVSPNPSNVTLEDCSGCLIHANGADVKLSLKGLKDVAVVYEPDTKVVLVAPINVSGTSIKDFFAKIKANKALRGYATGEVDKIVPTTTEYGKGDGFIEGTSKDCRVIASMGLAVVLDMGGENANTNLEVYPQSGNPEHPEIFVGKNAGYTRSIQERVNDMERLPVLPANTHRRLEQTHEKLMSDPNEAITIEEYATQHGLSRINAATELRYLSSIERELLDADGNKDRFAGIEMIDNPNGVNLGPLYRKFDIEAHGQKIAFRTYDLRAAVRSNYWHMPGMVEPKFFGAMMSEKLAFKSGLGAATYAIADAEENIYGKGRVPKDKLWALACGGCRHYSENLREAYALGLRAGGMQVLAISENEESEKRVIDWLDNDIGYGRRTEEDKAAFLKLYREHFQKRGILSTPQYYFLTRILRYRDLTVGVDKDQVGMDKARRHFLWGSHVTGSHNPEEYNGFKQTIVRWVTTKLKGVINYVLSINDAQMTFIKERILAEDFKQITKPQMLELQEAPERMSPLEVAYMHNEYVKARTRLGEDVWQHIMERELRKAKKYHPGISEGSEQRLLRHQGVEGFIMNTLRGINWDADWSDICERLEIDVNEFPNRPTLCAQRPFRVLTEIAEKTGREKVFGLDLMHGSAGLAQWAYMDLGLGDKLHGFRVEPDPTFKGAEPYPNLFEFVRFFVRDLKKLRIPGVARDEDGDRTILFTDDGRMIQGDIMEAVVAENRIRNEARKPKDQRKKLIFIGEVKFSSVLATHIQNTVDIVNDQLQTRGEIDADGTGKVEAITLLTPVGFGYIKDAMEKVSSAILNEKETIALFEGRPSPILYNGEPAPITLDLRNADLVIVGAELSGHQMDKFWFAEDELTLINLLSAWIENINETRETVKHAGGVDLLEEDPEALWNALNELVERVPVVSASPELRLGSEDEFKTEQVRAIFDTIRNKAGYDALVRTIQFTKAYKFMEEFEDRKPETQAERDQLISDINARFDAMAPARAFDMLPFNRIATDAQVCKEAIVQGTREIFVKSMQENFGLHVVEGSSKEIAGDHCFVYESDRPIEINLGGSFKKFTNLRVYMNRIDGMLVYFETEEGWGSFVIRKSNTQPEIISRIEGSTPEMRDAIGVFMLSYFEQFQGTDLARDVYVREEVLPKLAYNKLNDGHSGKLKSRLDKQVVPAMLARVKTALRSHALSKNLSLENLTEFVFLKDDEKAAELERLTELAQELEEKAIMPEDTDLAKIVHAYLGNVLPRDRARNVRDQYKIRIAGNVRGFGSEELYANENMRPLIAGYINIRVRDLLIHALDRGLLFATAGEPDLSIETSPGQFSISPGGAAEPNVPEHKEILETLLVPEATNLEDRSHLVLAEERVTGDVSTFERVELVTGQRHNLSWLIRKPREASEQTGVVFKLESGPPAIVEIDTNSGVVPYTIRGTLGLRIPFTVPSDAIRVFIKGEGSTVKVLYSETKEEKTVFTALRAAEEYRRSGKIADILAKEKKKGIQILMRDSLAWSLYNAGTGGDEGHRKNEEKVLSAFYGADVKIVTGNTWQDVLDHANPDEYLPVACLTEAEIKQIGGQDDYRLKQKLLMMPRLPIDGDVKNTSWGRGRFFVREIEALAVMLACTKREDIADEANTSVQGLLNAIRLMNKFDGALTSADLRALLPLGEDELSGTDREEILNRTIQKIMITIPMDRFDPREEKHRRRQVLWSV